MSTKLCRRVFSPVNMQSFVLLHSARACRCLGTAHTRRPVCLHTLRGPALPTRTGGGGRGAGAAQAGV